MYMDGHPLAELNSVQDSLLQAIWIRREQIRVFETNIGVLASGLTISPEMGKRIESLMEDYIEYVVPGTKEYRKQNDKAFISKTSNSLEQIAKVLGNFGGGKIKRNQFSSIIGPKGT